MKPASASGEAVEFDEAMPGAATAPEVSNFWQIVSRATAAIIGGYILTWWVGAAVAKAIAVSGGLIARGDAAAMSGLAQIITYVSIVMWVCATTSIKKQWAVLAVLTGICVAIVYLTPPVPPPPAPGGGGGGAGAAGPGGPGGPRAGGPGGPGAAGAQGAGGPPGVVMQKAAPPVQGGAPQ